MPISTTDRTPSFRKAAWFAATAMGLGLAATGAAAQEAEAVDQIVVTASRAAPSGFSAPTPTSVVSSQLIERQGANNIAQVLNQIPAFKATISPTSMGVRTPVPGSSTADLRGLGAQRNLVLVNGMRIVPQAPSATSSSGITVAPDLNQISSLMIDRIEVVTGGASAQWGSDAITGVVNVILRNKFKGLELKAQVGQSEVGDGTEYRLAGLAGTDFAGGRGHVVIGADLVRNNGVGDLYTRDWGRKEYQIVGNARFTTNGLPANVISKNVHSSISRNGLITGPANFSLRNFEFVPGGGLRPFQFGDLAGGLFMIGGQGEAFGVGVPLAPALTRFDPYLRAEFELTDKITAFAEASFAISRGTNLLLPSRDTAITIRRDNPYLPAQVAAAMDTARITSFTMNRMNYDLGVARTTSKNKTPHIAVGFNGDLGGGWSWDAHYGWGRNIYDNAITDTRNLRNFAFATDAVLSNGQVVCRATLPGAGFNTAAAGCVPVNLFGEGAVSQSAIGYINGVGSARSVYLQQTAAANLKGQPFSTWAGPVSVAAGLEWRRETQRVTGDPVGVTGAFEVGNSTPFAGAFNVKEAYAEAILPLARDSAFAKSFDFTGAVRVADYSSAGGQTTWKAGTTYEPLDGLRLRISRSRDIRAPAIFELFTPRGNGSIQPATVRGITATINASVSAGNPNLKPEKADTLTFGGVFDGRGALRGLRASVDYYDIKIIDSITTLSVANLASLCNVGQQFYCNAFTFDPVTGAPLTATFGLQNAASLQSQGIDFAVSYNTPLSTLIGSAPGDLALALSGTYTLHSYIDLGSGGGRIDRAGENSQFNTAAIPHLRMTFSGTYTAGRASLTTQAILIGKGTLDNTFNTAPANTVTDNEVPAIVYLNLFGSYDLAKNGRLKLSGGITNLLDKDPPPVPSATLFTATNGSYYDVIGRAFQVGLTYKY